MKSNLELLKENTVVIQNRNTQYMSTGFWITKNHVLTCGHSLDGFYDGSPYAGVQIEGKQFRDLRFSLVMDFRPNIDIAILKCENYYTKDILPLASTCELGNTMYGYAFQPQETYGRQFMLKYTGFATMQNGIEMLVLDGKIYPGFSGAPLFNPITQAICGIVWGVTQGGLEVYATAVSSFERYIRDVIPNYETKEIAPHAIVDTTKTIHQNIGQEIKVVRELIGSNKLKDAIKALKALPMHQSLMNDIYIIDAKHSAFERDATMKLKPYDVMQVEEGSIIQSLLRVTDQLVN